MFRQRLTGSLFQSNPAPVVVGLTFLSVAAGVRTLMMRTACQAARAETSPTTVVPTIRHIPTPSPSRGTAVPHHLSGGVRRKRIFTVPTTYLPSSGTSTTRTFGTSASRKSENGITVPDPYYSKPDFGMPKRGEDPHHVDSFASGQSSGGGELLHLAARTGDTARVIDLVTRHKLDPNLLNPSTGFNALHVAASNGHAQTIKWLLDINRDETGGLLAKIETVSGCDGSTALHLACQKGHAAVVEALLQEFADVRARDAHGYSPLHVAASSGSLATVDILLRDEYILSTMVYPIRDSPYKVDPVVDFNAQGGPLGATALHVAVLHGHTDIVRAILRRGVATCNLRLEDQDGMIPLDLAVRYRHHEIIELLELELELGDSSSHNPSSSSVVSKGSKWLPSPTQKMTDIFALVIITSCFFILHYAEQIEAMWHLMNKEEEGGVVQ